jgi:hypothetical protein
LGSNTSGTNAALVPGGAVSGTVTASGGVPLSSVWAYAYSTGVNPVELGEATSGVNGTYEITGLAAGTYYVCFDTPLATGGNSTTGYADQCYNDVAWDSASDDVSGTDVTVDARTTTSGIDATLADGGAISGTVDDSSGDALANVAVLAFTTGANQDEARYATTGANGAYTLSGLNAGSYDVCFDSQYSGDGTGGGYTDQCYKGVDWDDDSAAISGATAVTVNSDQTTPDVSAALAPGGAISGTVLDTSENPLQGVSVDVYTSGATHTLVNYEYTDDNGNYLVPGLPAGTYDVCFDASFASGPNPSTTYADQCYNGVSWEGPSTGVSGATSVTVSVGTVVSQIGADLAPNATG